MGRPGNGLGIGDFFRAIMGHPLTSITGEGRLRGSTTRVFWFPKKLWRWTTLPGSTAEVAFVSFGLKPFSAVSHPGRQSLGNRQKIQS